MLKAVGSKVAWLGRTASMVLGLALMLALVLGVATAAFAANGNNFVLGVLNNSATAITRLTGNVPGGLLFKSTTSILDRDPRRCSLAWQTASPL